MIGGGAMDGFEGQAELCTESTCEQCAGLFVPRNRNGLRARFCSPACSRRWHNAQKVKGAALLKEKATRKKGPSAHARKVSRFVFLNLVPLEQRADLLREAARNLGITDEGEVLKALRRNGCATKQEAVHA